HAGGGVENAAVSLTMTNCSMSGNTATNGGGVSSGTFETLTNCTISGNFATRGGGLYINGRKTTLNNTIVAGNLNGTPPSDIINTTTLVGSNNLIGNGGSGGLTNGASGNLVGIANPGLAPLGNYGGPTQTFALLPGSPAIDGGKNSQIP